VRLSLAFLVLVIAMSISGISSAMVSSLGEDCCTDGPEAPLSGVPSDTPERCPPFCHVCACSPAFAVPPPHVPLFVGSVEHAVPAEAPSTLPKSPPSPDVFHPPRR
jgi:hypothetical protein